MTLARSYLFAPGNNDALLRKVFDGGADAVVLDLEDAVPPAEKAAARMQVARVLAQRPSDGCPAVWVRINDAEGDLWREDLAAAVGPALTGVRLPKVESVAAARRVEEALGRAEETAGLTPGRIALALTLETARGVLAAPDLAACPRVRHLTFGAADFAQDVGAEPGDDEAETLLARSLLVLAGRAAGIDPPVAAAYTRLQDDAGLARSSRSARRLGFFGRSCIHPRQVPIVHEAFTPRPEELARAREIVDAYAQARASGSGVLTLPDGQFVDLPVVRRAQALLNLAGGLDRETVKP
jgi:citrate lyase subunit beta/citryl-CoA lyase